MSDLEQIKQKIDIVSLINEYVPLKKSGRNFSALCPFHEEKTPSFIVSPERQIWHCFGACGEGGDIFTFLMKIENLEFPEALEILAQKAGVKLTKSYRVTKEQKLKEEILKANVYASNFYHYLLTSHSLGKKARLYLEQRKISQKIADTFALGYAPNAWDSLYRFLRKKGFSDFVLTKAGLVSGTKSRFYDRFRGRLIFTLKNHRGEVVGFSGRKILEKQNDKEAKYINTAETPVYVKGNLFYGLDVTKEAIKKANQAILVEGEFDFLASFQAGITNVVAIKGTALTEAQVNLIKRFTDTIALALDSDLAGDSAVWRGIEIADNAGLNVKVVAIPLGKDPDECIRENSALWKKAVGKSIPVYDFLLNSALQRFNPNEVFGKKKIVEAVLPFYARISNAIVQGHYLRRLSKTLEISEEKIIEGLEQFKKNRFSVRQKFSFDQVNNKRRSLLLEEYFLSLLLQANSLSLINQALTNEELARIITFIENPAVRRILKAFEVWLTKQTGSVLKTAEFIKTLPLELINLADKAFLFDLSQVSKNQLFNEELKKVKLELLKIGLRRRIEAISTKIKTGQTEATLEALNQEFNSLKEELKKLSRENKQ